MAPQVALVTGCVSGSGLASAALLSRDPNQRFVVIATVISLSQQDDLVAALGDTLGKTAFIKEMDITDDGRIFDVVREVVDEHGKIDILLNIAGIGTSGYLDAIPRRRIDQAFNINTIGVIRLTQAVLPHMKQRKTGQIITITSRGGRTGISLLEVYCASKFATEGFFESLAPVAKQHNIRISMVEPGAVRTGMQDVIFNDMEKVIADESVNDLDRGFFRKWVDGVKSNPATLTPDEVAQKLLSIIDTEQPMLRYPMPDALGEEIAKILADMTGRTGIELNEKRLTDSTKH